ncbi:MAG: glycosyltransferase [Burkholderiales bacterium]|nr:glycosyltransferase [Burkholderiales bacterium]MDE1925917.1 glycosyltransferase [Burkholderiales bacterium]MDE2157434.1 glycosyltransferase [Burkholderiales bacterium]
MKILYLMHVGWHWIRQRPQVLAEMLAREHELRVMHYAIYRRGHRSAGTSPPPGSRVLHRVPGRFKRALPVLGAIDAGWLARQVAAEIRRFQPDLVWVTHPDFEPALRAAGVPRIVYDCMDDHLAFGASNSLSLARDEIQLLAAAELTLFSSASLMQRVRHRAPVGRCAVVNNGVDSSLCQRAPVAVAPPDGRFRVGYFGTISHWFDWPLVLRWIEALPELEFELAGPVETALPRHPRIHHRGVIGHRDLADFSARCQVLAMPFKVTPLIRTVDPVKLYEYIAFDRPALAPRYAESERFEPHVDLYRDGDEALALLRRWAPGTMQPVLPRPSRSDFLAANTWQRRMVQISALLGS